MVYDNNGPIYSALDGKQWTPGFNGQLGINSVTISGSSNSLLNGTYTRGQDELYPGTVDGCPGDGPEGLSDTLMVASYQNGSLKLYGTECCPQWTLIDTSCAGPWLGCQRDLVTLPFGMNLGGTICDPSYMSNGVAVFPGGGFEWWPRGAEETEQITFTAS
jgi:hypothetical protein